MKKFLIRALFVATILFHPLGWAGNAVLPVTKQQQWGQMAAKIDTWCDGVGCPLDVGIKETVIALNLLGIETDQSCEGHLKRGSCAPWVRVKDNTAKEEELWTRIARLREVFNAEQTELSVRHPGLPVCELESLPEGKKLHILRIQQEELTEQLRMESTDGIKKLFELVSSFYESHTCVHSDMLLVDGRLGYLQSAGAEHNKYRSSKLRAHKLRRYQREMREFTLFLKNLFFLDEQ